MLRPIFRHVFPLLLVSLFACKKELAQEQTPLRMIPVPRELERGADQPLGEALILLPERPSERAAAAAEEINLRLRELGAPLLKVAAAGSEEKGTFSFSAQQPSAPQGGEKVNVPFSSRGRRIELALASPGGDAAVPQAPQGYLVDTAGSPTRLVGRDEQGLLWAAVTFCRMLRATGDGQIILASARVRDWPDFGLRAMNRVTSYYRERTERGLLAALKRSRTEPGRYADAYVYDTKRVVDFLVRLKLNLAWLPLSSMAAGLDALARESGGPERAEAFLATLRRVSQHAQARGLTLCDVAACAVGTSPADDRDPTIARCVLNRTQGHYYCWSQDELVRRRAEDAARLYAAAGYQMVLLQLPDGGGLANPGHWNERCKDCRERWGEDRAAADAHLATIWHQVFRKLAPAATLAVIQYPSDPAILLQPDEASYEPARAYLTALHKRLPNDPRVAVCVRESARPAVVAFYKLFEGRPVLAQWMTDATSGEHQWCPLFSSRARFAQTFREPKRDVWVLASSSSSAPLAAAAAAQYLWNADSPGAGPWAGDLDVERDGAEPAAFFSTLLPSFAAEAFGEKAAPCLLDAFKGCLSPSYCLLPGDVARVAETPNTAARMGQQYDALVRASGGIERLWQRFEAGERQLIFAETAPYFYGLSEQVARSRAWASYHLARLRAVEALRAGEPKPAIAAELRGRRKGDILLFCAAAFGAPGGRKGECPLFFAEADAALAARMDARVAQKPKAGKADPSRSLIRPLRARYDDTAYDSLASDLRRLLGVLEGRTLEVRDAPDAPLPPRFLLPEDDREVVLRGKGSTTLSFVPYPTRGGRKTALQVEGLTIPAHDGFAVGFPPVDVSDYVKAGGVLRFYVNGGGAGGQQLTFRLHSDTGRPALSGAEGMPVPPVPQPGSAVAQASSLWVSLADHVAIDDLDATWQLVSIPLDRLLPAGYTRVVGFGMSNLAPNEVCGPLWLDGLRVAAEGNTVEAEVPVQGPPPQPPATEARVLALGVQPTTYVAADGMASRLMLGLKVLGNGTLSNVRIELRFLTPEGKLLRSHQAAAAQRIRTPWWSTSLRYDLGVLLPKAQLEMALTSNEVKATGSVTIRW